MQGRWSTATGSAAADGFAARECRPTPAGTKHIPVINQCVQPWCVYKPSVYKASTQKPLQKAFVQNTCLNEVDKKKNLQVYVSFDLNIRILKV